MRLSIAHLRAAGMSDAQILRIVEEAEARIREQNRIRQRNHRARNASHGDMRDGRDKRDIGIEIESRDSISKKVKKERKHTIRDDWKPSEADRAYARTKGWPEARIDTEGERFRFHHVSKGDLVANEHAAWCKWVMSPYQNGGKASTASSSMPSASERWDRVVREQLAERARIDAERKR